MFIVVKKIEERFIRTIDGTAVRNPKTMEGIKSEPKLVDEMIEIASIKSARNWKKAKEEEDPIEGDVTIVYFKPGHNSESIEKKETSNSKDKKTSVPSMKISESFDSFTSRLNAIKLNVLV